MGKTMDALKDIASGRYRKGYVLMMDVLGFKDFVSLKPDFDFIKCWRTLKHDINESAKNIQFISNKCRVEVLFLSDTVVVCFSPIVSNIDKDEDILHFIPMLIQSFFLKYMEEYNLFFRGALSYGEFYFHSGDNIVMGSAINEAYEWHESTDWIGIILTPSAEYKYNILNSKVYAASNFFHDFREYLKIPFKDDAHRLVKTTILWIAKDDFSGLGSDIINRLNRLFSNINHSPRFSAKYKNTIEYVRWVKDHPNS